MESSDTPEKLRDEMDRLRRRVEELEQLTAEQTKVVQSLRESESVLRMFIEHSPAAIAMLDNEMRYLMVSNRWMQEYKLGDQNIIGRSHYEVFPDLPKQWYDVHKRVLAGASESKDDDPYPRADGGMDWLSWAAIPWRKADGSIGGLLFFTQVVTRYMQAELSLRESEAQLREINEQQQRLISTIREISTPVIPVYDEIIVLPLVGTIDSARSGQIMETLLTGVQQYSAEIVIIDITGVPFVDTAVANHLIQATRAATLLGAHCVLVGVSAEVAQTLVQLGVNLSVLVTRSNLQSGITYALERQGREIVIQEARQQELAQISNGLFA